MISRPYVIRTCVMPVDTDGLHSGMTHIADDLQRPDMGSGWIDWNRHLETGQSSIYIQQPTEVTLQQ